MTSRDVGRRAGFPEKKDEFFEKIRNISEKFNVKLPHQLAASLVIALVSEGHLIVDCGHDDSAAYCLSICQIVPIVVGLRCAHIVCSSLTTPDELLDKLASERGLASSVDLDSGSSKDGRPADALLLKATQRHKVKQRSVDISEVLLTHSSHRRYPSAGSGASPKKGPHMAQVAVVEHLDRAPASTQAALFEVMRTGRLQPHAPKAELFTVILVRPQAGGPDGLDLDDADAPESEASSASKLDAFLMRIVLPRPIHVAALPELHASAYSRKEILALRAAAQQVYIHTDVAVYMRSLVVGVRNEAAAGPSPRAGSALQQVVRVVAVLSGQRFVTPNHVEAYAVPVLSHRIACPRRLAPEEVVEMVLESEPPPI